MYEQMNKPMHVRARDEYQNAMEPGNLVLLPRSTNKPLYPDPTRIVTVLRMWLQHVTPYSGNINDGTNERQSSALSIIGRCVERIMGKWS